MAANNPAHYRGLSKTTRIPPCVVKIDDVRRLYVELSTKSNEALEKHLSAQRRPPETPEVRWEELKQEVRRIGGLTVIVIGADGEQVVSDSTAALLGEQLPDKIASIAFDSANGLRLQNIVPMNRFRLNLDFTEPPGFGAYNPWEEPTPNGSTIEIIGSDSTWGTGVHEFVLQFFRKRGKPRRWFHTALAFNLMHWLIAFPVGLWIVYRLDTQFTETLSPLHGALRGGLYVYVVLMVLLLFRIMTHAFRWTFPLVEIEGSRSKRVRAGINFVLIAILTGLIYDIARAIYNAI